MKSYSLLHLQLLVVKLHEGDGEREATNLSWPAEIGSFRQDRDAAELKLHNMMEKATEAERRLLQKEYGESIIAQKRQQDEVARGNRIIDKMWKDDWLSTEQKAAEKKERDRKAFEAEKHRKANNKKFLLPAIKDAQYLDLVVIWLL